MIHDELAGPDGERFSAAFRVSAEELALTEPEYRRRVELAASLAHHALMTRAMDAYRAAHPELEFSAPEIVDRCNATRRDDLGVRCALAFHAGASHYDSATGVRWVNLPGNLGWRDVTGGLRVVCVRRPGSQSYGSGLDVFYGQSLTGIPIIEAIIMDPPRSPDERQWLHDVLGCRMAPGSTMSLFDGSGWDDPL